MIEESEKERAHGNVDHLEIPITTLSPLACSSLLQPMTRGSPKAKRSLNQPAGYDVQHFYVRCTLSYRFSFDALSSARYPRE